MALRSALGYGLLALSGRRWRPKREYTAIPVTDTKGLLPPQGEEVAPSVGNGLPRARERLECQSSWRDAGAKTLRAKHRAARRDVRGAFIASRAATEAAKSLIKGRKSTNLVFRDAD